MIPVVWLALALLMSGFVGAAFAGTASSFLKKTDDWFRGDEAKRIAVNILSWQTTHGDWPKNTNTTEPFTGDRASLKGTFDNSATTDELRFLARRVAATQDRAYVDAFTRGLEHILRAQYTNGGWPQYSPPPKSSYHRHITFNDGTMVRLMEFVREVEREPRYDFVPSELRQQCQRAFDRGVACILKTQVTVNGKLTAWCAQHDEVDLSPRPARAFEMVSLSGAESVGIVRLLMSVEKPSPEIVRSVEAAVAWLESAKLPGIKVIDAEAKGTAKGKDKTVVKDATAKPMWARFYEIESNRPFFCGRDGVKKYALAEIEFERRNGYAWLGYWPETLLTREYPEWKKRLAKR